jgi:hypothetical protein
MLDDGVELVIRNNAKNDLGFENGIMFEGESGRFLVNRGKLVGRPVEQLLERPLPEDALERLYGQAPAESHMKNFIDCIKTNRQPISDAASHHQLLSVCHAANIAIRLNRKLTYDSSTEQFVNDVQANSFVGRRQRKGFEIKL